MGEQAEALEGALTSTDVADRDQAAVGLARMYAGLIDSAAPAAKYRKALALLGKALPLAAGDDIDSEDLYAAFDTVQVALAEHSVASDLGPKLLATLTALGLTPAGRGEKGKAPSERTAKQDQLSALRARKADRQRRTPDLHTSAP